MEFDDFENGDLHADICELVEALEQRVRTVLDGENPHDIAQFLAQLVEMSCEGLQGEALPPKQQIELLRMHLDPREVPDDALREFFSETIGQTASVPVGLFTRTMHAVLATTDDDEVPHYVVAN